MTELDDIAPNLIGAGSGRIQVDQFGSDKWRAVLSIFNGPQFVRDAATPSEALRLVLIEADREAADKVRRYRQAMNDRAGAALAKAQTPTVDAAVAPADDFDSLVGDDFEGLLG